MQGISVRGLDAAFRTLRLAYQPIVCWSRRTAVGYEALARCRGLGPAALFELAEQAGRVHELSRRLRAAARVPENADLYLNVHPLDLLDPHLYTSNAPLSQSATRVVLELTEREPPHSARHVAFLRELGYRIALDDLGAGYADLSTLTTLRPDVVKLDRQLVRHVDRDATRRQVIRSFVGMCDDLGMELICEGVETRAELDVLLRLGCDLFQGFLFGMPE